MFKVDTHVHSSEGSPCGKVPITEIVKLYKGAGYNGIVITNHYSAAIFDKLRFAEMKSWNDKIQAYTEIYETAKHIGEDIGLSVFLGIELKNFENKNDYLIYGITKQFLLENERLYNKPLHEIKKIIDDNGLIMIQAHPFRDNCVVAPIELIDGVEVFNGHFNHDSNNSAASRLGKKMGKIVTSGSDFHDYADLGNGGIIFNSAPQTDDFAEALRTIPYKLIKTSPQWLDILMIDLKEQDLLNADDIIDISRHSFAKLIVLNFNGDVKQILKFTKKLKKKSLILICNGKVVLGKECVINRISIFLSPKGLENNNIFEPSVIICDKISDELTNDLKSRHVSTVIANITGHDKPYLIGDTKICGFDNKFKAYPRGYLVSIMGPNVFIEDIII